MSKMLQTPAISRFPEIDFVSGAPQRREMSHGRSPVPKRRERRQGWTAAVKAPYFPMVPGRKARS